MTEPKIKILNSSKVKLDDDKYKHKYWQCMDMPLLHMNIPIYIALALQIPWVAKNTLVSRLTILSKLLSIKKYD